MGATSCSSKAGGQLKEPSLTYILLLSESSPHAVIWMQCPTATRERR